MTSQLTITPAAYLRREFDAAYERHSAKAGHRLELTVHAPRVAHGVMVVTTSEEDRDAVAEFLAEMEGLNA